MILEEDSLGMSVSLKDIKTLGVAVVLYFEFLWQMVFFLLSSRVLTRCDHLWGVLFDYER
jgi:hypothetical protein